MRLKSEVWVKAYMRRCHAALASATLVRRGNEEAGAIYIKVARPDGTAALFGPAPAGLDGEQTGRRFAVHRPAGTPDAGIEETLARQISFDEDLWVVEVEDREGRHFLDTTELEGGR